MTDAELIKALGGPTVVARALGLNVQTVGNWVTRASGIPAKQHIPLWRMAQAAGIAWTPPKAHGIRLTMEDAALLHYGEFARTETA